MNNVNLNEANVNKSANPTGGGSGPPELSASLQKAIDSLIKTGPNLLSGGSGAGPQTPASSASSDYFSAFGNRGGRGGYWSYWDYWYKQFTQADMYSVWTWYFFLCFC